jgi:hypothetical protein
MIADYLKRTNVQLVGWAKINGVAVSATARKSEVAERLRAAGVPPPESTFQSELRMSDDACGAVEGGAQPIAATDDAGDLTIVDDSDGNTSDEDNTDDLEPGDQLLQEEKEVAHAAVAEAAAATAATAAAAAAANRSVNAAAAAPSAP